MDIRFYKSLESPELLVVLDKHIFVFNTRIKYVYQITHLDGTDQKISEQEFRLSLFDYEFRYNPSDINVPKKIEILNQFSKISNDLQKI